MFSIIFSAVFFIYSNETLFIGPFLLLGVNPERFTLSNFEDSVIQNFKREKKQKRGLITMSWQGNIADLFLLLSARHEKRLKRFHSLKK